MEDAKVIRLTKHAEQQAELRGATEDEIADVIRTISWGSASRGRYQPRKHLVFDQVSPVNQKYYRFKTVHPFFVDEEEEIVVITVKVYYSNEEQEP
jgi:hypothetical protein